jgi:hypothetical protein
MIVFHGWQIIGWLTFHFGIFFISHHEHAPEDLLGDMGFNPTREFYEPNSWTAVVRRILSKSNAQLNQKSMDYRKVRPTRRPCNPFG